jgi:hypothetical protein
MVLDLSNAEVGAFCVRLLRKGEAYGLRHKAIYNTTRLGWRSTRWQRRTNSQVTGTRSPATTPGLADAEGRVVLGQVAVFRCRRHESP